MENKPFHWCFIGIGRLAHQVADEITKSGKHEIVSVYSRRIESAQEFAVKFGGKAFVSAENAITADGVDGVYVVTPHSAHYPYVKQALELGNPVLCEKAFTTDAAKAKELFELAEKRGVYLVEAMWTWFSPVANKVREWLVSGEFGEIKEVVANYHMDSRGYAPRVTDPNLAGGALLDVGVYPITYLYRLFGKPTDVRCVGVLENGIDLKEDVTMTFPSGETYTASMSIVDNKGLERFRIIGTKAEISIRFFHSANKATLRRKDGKSEVFKGDGSMLNEFDRVAAEIRMGKTESGFVPRQATLDIMEIMDECRRQMGLVYPFEK